MVHSKTLQDYEDARDAFQSYSDNEHISAEQQLEYSSAALTAGTRCVRATLQITSLDDQWEQPAKNVPPSDIKWEKNN